jgi:zinc/manganese transport system substrate-binding protein
MRSAPSRRRIRVAALASATALVLAACTAGEEATTPEPTPDPAPTAEPTVEPVTLVVTTAVLGDVVTTLVGDDGAVQVLMAAGVDPHGYEASAADAAAMRSADLVIANGLLLEEGLISALEAAAADGVEVLTIADKVDPIEFAEGGHDHGDEHEHGDEDPHFWWDPMRMVMAVDVIAAELTTLRPEIDWAARASAYNTQVLAAHEQMVTLFATIPAENCRIITNHDALGYLAARYDFEVIGTVIPGRSTTVATNARAFAELIDLMVTEGVSVVFADNTDSTVLAEQLATQTAAGGGADVTVVQILTGSPGGPGSGADTYLTMLVRTAEQITAALRDA